MTKTKIYKEGDLYKCKIEHESKTMKYSLVSEAYTAQKAQDKAWILSIELRCKIEEAINSIRDQNHVE